MVETEDLLGLRMLNLELLRQLWVGQDAVRRSVAKAASESRLDFSNNYDPETSLSQETSSASSRASCPRGKCHAKGPPDAHQSDPFDVASCKVASLQPAKCQSQASLGQPRSHSSPWVATSDSKDPEPSVGPGDLGPQEKQALKSVSAQGSKQFKPKVTFSEESEGSVLPDRSWRLRPYLGYDWIAGALDNSSPVTSQPETFFSKLQEFREANKEECICSHPEPQFLGQPESSNVEEEHECVYCYRVNRRLFVVPLDPGTPCRLCRKPRSQQDRKTLERPVQVRVSIPLSILDPPHQYRIHRRKSFDNSDTLALPRHCLLGWDILPPKSEKSSAPKSLDLWSAVSSGAQHRKPSAIRPSCLALPVRVPPPTWIEPQVPVPHVPRQ
ncbi:migration and invasion-inhibitory protein isoform X2 [Nycticebus coucang]|uniref:migration and invasion-inhibitory protein isoform X2 n=1 Tax=Nycticebus coucang TaxID=9470 RepID=UPI00234D6575|nr:migration and invasion-inhibitory protein isoform X2 [Nycticebus coucang]XP_053431646.1 migration and invasion-inhibitory protein isoform X2 [Nycticebus coucang]XP_053431648.1 migration and invasion-inhibitory protein isoform X2 [Nycticebus coucang]